MEHLWHSSEERKQWECLNCGTTVPHEVTPTAPPAAKDMAHANHPGSAPHIVSWVRELGEACHAGVITAEQDMQARAAHAQHTATA